LHRSKNSAETVSLKGMNRLKGIGRTKRQPVKGA
jgi:hypothetical protein